MKRYVYRNEVLWTLVVGLILWNLGLTFRTSNQTIVTLDLAKIVRVAAQQLSDESEGEGLEIAKDKLAHRLRATVQAFALKHKAIVVDASTIIAGVARDITEEVIKEVTQ